MILLGVGKKTPRPSRRHGGKGEQPADLRGRAGEMNRSLLDVKGERWWCRNSRFTATRGTAAAKFYLSGTARAGEEIV